MDEHIKHACHKVYCIKYHLMFCVKYRKDMFMEDKYLFALKSVLDEIAKRYFLKFETMGIDEDHVHMLLELAHKYSPSHLV